jgi:hypothetical protein
LLITFTILFWYLNIVIESNFSSKTGVPNLWYEYHWWYENRSQVVRQKCF